MGVVWCGVGWSRWKIDERQNQSQQFYACDVPSEKKSLDWSGASFTIISLL